MSNAADTSIHPLHISLWRHCRWAAAFAMIVFLILAQPRTAYAQNASCGEPERKHVLDAADNSIDRTITFEKCLVREFEINGEPKKIIAYWTEIANSVPVTPTDVLHAVDIDGQPGTDLSPAAMALITTDWVRATWETYRSWGFGDPNGSNVFIIHIFNMTDGVLGECCTDGAMVLDGPLLMDGFQFGPGDRRSAQSIVVHEMWHAVQPVRLGGWVEEGTASWSEDVTDAELDAWQGTTYANRVTMYMLQDHVTNLEKISYHAAPWWTYFAEQVGTIMAEPGRGVDAMLEFYQASGGPMARLDAVINAHRPDTFITLWMRFAQANYIKEFDPANQRPEFRYTDQLPEGGNGNYPDVRIQARHPLPSGAVLPTLSSVQPWSSAYYLFDVNESVPHIDLHVRTDINRPVGFALLAFRGNTLVKGTESIGTKFDKFWVNDDYDHLVLIVVGLREGVGFRYSVNATAPALQIVDPVAAQRATVGLHDATEKLLIKVNIFGDAEGNPIAGIDPNAIAISIGGITLLPELRISGAYVQGQYWLLVRAPAQPADGDYDLVVNYGELSDTEVSAVRYDALRNADTVIVLDRSNSMQSDAKIGATKDAARLYVDSYDSGDFVGLVIFEGDATVAVPLREWESGRQDVLNGINAVVADGGATSPGDGLKTGLDALIALNSLQHTWTQVVLSDGLENAEIPIENYIAMHDARRTAMPPKQVAAVHAIAVCSDADRLKMERLAARTNGRYFVVAVPDVTVAAVNDGALATDLAEVYRVVSEEITQQQQVYVARRNFCADTTVAPEFHKIWVDAASGELVVVAAWSHGDVADPDMVLKQPDGTLSDPPTVSDGRHLVWRIATPPAGEWILAVGEKMSASDAGFRPNLVIDPCIDFPHLYLVEAAVASDLTMDLYLGLAVEERLVGEPMPIFVTLADTAPIADASVIATITRPNGAAIDVALYDDGLHNDGEADDGFYGALFANTTIFGGYDLVVNASGTSPRTGDFVRRTRAGFNMVEFRELPGLDDAFQPNRPLDYTNPDDANKPYVDIDGDYVPDWWENKWGLDPDLTSLNTADEDPDYDGATNLDEFVEGSDPTYSDSDGGGQNDGSEIFDLRNPLDGSDDAVSCPFAFSASTIRWNGHEPELLPGILLHYDVGPAHETVSIERASNADGPWTTIMENAEATGEYHDTGVGDGETAYYLLRAYAAEGQESCVLGPIFATAGEGTLPPSGFVTINYWHTRTMDVDVTLRLEATYGTTEMLISNNLDFDGAEWEVFVLTKPWTLAPVESIGTVYVRFRDDDGNESDTQIDSILVDLSGPDPDPGPGGNVDLYLPSLQQSKQE